MKSDNAHVEIEARFLNTEQSAIEKTLHDIGAVRQGKSFFKEWIFAKPEWASSHRRVRVRTDGTTHTFTYKANATWAIDSTEEVEFDVSSPDAAAKCIQAMDIPLVRYQEKKRIRYQLGDIVFDLDFWPKIPMVLEIEAPTEAQVQEGAKLLGLDWNDAVFEDQMMVHLNYGVDLRKVTEYRFEDEK